MIRSLSTEITSKDALTLDSEGAANQLITDNTLNAEPSIKFSDAIDVEKSVSLKIRVIAPRYVDASHQSFIDFLRNSWLGGFYVNYIKRYPAIHGLVILAWSSGYPIFIKYVSTPILFVRLCFDKNSRHQLRKRELVKQSDYISSHSQASDYLSAVTEVVTPIPFALPVKDRGYLVSPHEHFEFPQIIVSEVTRGVIYGGSNLVLVDDVVLCHDLYDFARDSTSEELHGRTLIDVKKRRIRWYQHDELPEAVPCAAAFTDATAPNYAHWLTEVLPKIAMFCAESKFAHVPLIVDAGLHRNLMESLSLIAGRQREIICLPLGRAIAVERLYVTSACGYVPFGRRNTELSGHSHGLFSPVALGKVRTKLIEAARKLGVDDSPEKIYLRRTSGARKVINAAEIEKLLVSQGFSIVEPEKLSFLEQVRLFSNAKVVLGSSGAALANIIFCPPETAITILISTFSDTSYWYWQNIACATGNQVNYVLGSISKGNHLGIHADFTVEQEELKKILFSSWRELVKQSDYIASHSQASDYLSAVTEVVTPIPFALPVKDRGNLVSPHEHFEFPQIIVSEVTRGVVYGGSNLVLVDDVVLCHDLYDFARDSTSEELHGRTLIDVKKRRIRWYQHDELPEAVPCAAAFTDATAPNYAHWLTEVLPKIAMFCAESKFAHVPLIVDAGLHRNLMESLSLIAGRQREIICLPLGRAIAVERLYVTSACGYVPFGRRNTELSGHSHGLFSPVALGKVRTKLIEAARKLGVDDSPEKIYLRRTSGARKVINAAEIEKLLVSQGFSIVEPEKLSFLEQVRLFSNAKVVLGSSGAALANIIFCPPETAITILISTFSDTSYWYWQNIACATGNQVNYVMGHFIFNDPGGIHADFIVDLKDINILIESGFCNE
jgi:capsular polysaccharide biosynthesis protein